MKIVLVLMLSVAVAVSSKQLDAQSRKLIVDTVNNDPTSTWKAKYYGIKRSYGLKINSNKKRLPLSVFSEDELLDIPASFDARKKWPKCETIGEIRDQGNCGSCWAVSSASVISDRICVAGGGSVRISSEDVNDCANGGGCEGGLPSNVMNDYVNTGFVTGGPYKSNFGCMPYTIKNCSHHVQGSLPLCNGPEAPTPACVRKCRSGYGKPYNQDLHFGKSAFSVGSDVKQIQKHIMTTGPVTAGFNVYEDFENYHTGVYSHKTGPQLGGHAVRIIGWGTESGTDYWLIANSWNAEWGEKGLVKFLRGQDECGIEEMIDAAEPKLK